jgi:hypothetical protein
MGYNKLNNLVFINYSVKFIKAAVKVFRWIYCNSVINFEAYIEAGSKWYHGQHLTSIHVQEREWIWEVSFGGVKQNLTHCFKNHPTVFYFFSLNFREGRQWPDWQWFYHIL